MGDDPCQFGLVGVLDATPSSEQLHLYSTMDGEISAQSMARDALSNAVLIAFAWTSAMAYNAGKNSTSESLNPFRVN